MRTWLSVLIMLLPVLLLAQEQEAFTLSGRINAPNPKGRIYVFLCDRESFENNFAAIDTVSFWVNYDKTHVYYEFKNIPQGEYAIWSYQDVNGNHKLDKWLFGPREPWGFSYSGKMKYPPVFDDVSFNLMFDLRLNLVLGK